LRWEGKDEDELPIDVEESDGREEVGGLEPEPSRPIRYEEEISRPSIMVADDHETEELSGELKEDPIVMSFVQVVGKRRTGFSDNLPPSPPAIKADSRPPPPPPKGDDAPPILRDDRFYRR